LLAIALQAEGMESVSYAGWQVPIRTNSAYTKARIESIDDVRVRADLDAGKVVIVTGFQGLDEHEQHHHAWAVAGPTPRPWPWPLP
jgi:aspartate kinase